MACSLGYLLKTQAEPNSISKETLEMANILISDLQPAGSGLFSDSESFITSMKDLSENELKMTLGGKHSKSKSKSSKSKSSKSKSSCGCGYGC
jgi:DNA-directed RNA polymerase specialized sigma54-like protein